jgi:uncharacterized membrane protein
MIEQHVNYWLCGDLPRPALVLAASALGGLAAPLFVTLAGLGVTLAAQRKQAVDRVILLRGVGVMGFGYLLNALAPHWFSLGSWYVLHLIGFALCLSPLLRRLPSPALGGAIALVLVATLMVQNALGTPFLLTNRHMSDPGGAGGLLRHALAEGYFPIFPWIAFFMAGMLAGRWIGREQRGRIVALAAALLIGSLALAVAHASGLDLTRHQGLQRLFRVTSSFYPSLAPMSLFLMSCALLLISSFVALESRARFAMSSPLVSLGRASLTLLILHIVVIRESAVRFEFWRSLGATETLLVNAGVLAAAAVLAHRWQRAGFRLGAEWWLRRFAG